MTENRERGIQHLTNLDIDIRGIAESLQEAQKQIEQFSLEAGRMLKFNFSDSLKFSFENGQNTPVLDSNNIQNVKSEVENLAESYSKLSRVVETLDKEGNPLSRQETYDTGIGKQIVETYKYVEDEYELQNSRHINNIRKREAEEEKARQKEISTIQKTSKQLTNLADKYDTLAARSKRAGREGIASQAQETSAGIRKIADALKNQEISVEEARLKLEKYEKELVKLRNGFIESGVASESFLKKLQNKFAWMTSYYLINRLMTTLRDCVHVIKETEDAVVQLQRVLNEDISQTALSDELYNIAFEYGRSFSEVSEVATKFAQSGKTWNETIELTKSTMLALNTAELDVTQSTEGIIAILAQWNLQAEDMQGVIDKINITADNFAVTSEKIVSALQRSSSSAKNANISLEETIGIITAMAEATGRSGENIGTALNSLIIYTTKASSLEVFAGLSDQMDAIVKKYRTGTASIFDVWQALSKEISGLTAQQQENILKMTDYSQFADELESQAVEYTDKIKETYQTAGSYRQNYFIALLQDMEKALAAIANMSNAEGYSLSENEKYMQTLTASYEQLKVMLMDLAVQLGEAGLADMLKYLVQLGINVAKLTKSLGGLLPVLINIGSVIALIRAQKIGENISKFTGNLKNIPSILKGIAVNAEMAAAAEAKAAQAATIWKTAFSWISVVGIALSTLWMAISGVNSKIEETNRTLRESAKENMNEAKAIQTLKEEYAEITKMQDGTAKKTEALTNFKNKLIETYHDEKDAIENLNGARADEIDFLDKEYAANVRAAYHDIEEQYKKSVEEIENASSSKFLSFKGLFIKDFSPIEDYVESIEQYGDVIKIDFGTTDLYEQNKIIENILSNVKVEKRLYDELNRILKDNKEVIDKNQDSYKTGIDIVAEEFFLRDEMLKLLKEYSNADTDENRAEVLKKIKQYSEENVPGLKAQEEFIRLTNEALDITSEKADETGESLKNAFEIPQTYIDSLTSKIKDLNNSIDGFQSGYNTLISAVQEFNENGYLSVDTIQSLISAGGEYISLLEFTNGGIQLNKERTDALLVSQTKNINALLQQAATAEICRVVNEELGKGFKDTADSEDAASQKSDTLSSKVQSLSLQLVAGTITLTEFNNQLAIMAGEAGEQLDTDALTAKLTPILNGFNAIAKSIGNLSVNTVAWGSSAASAAKSQTDSLKKELEAQKKAIKERYDAEINALKEVQAENDRLAKQEEYYRKRKDYQNNIEKAATRSGVEYREQEAEARRKLDDLDREWAETVEKWSIEDQIKELERLRDAEIAEIDAQIELLNAKTSAAFGNIVGASSGANQVMGETYIKEYLEPVIEKTEDTFTYVSDYINSVFDKTYKQLLVGAVSSVDAIKDVYEQRFFWPMFNMSEKLKTNIMPYLPSSQFSSPFNIMNPITSSSIVNNTNNSQNANVYANIFSKTSAAYANILNLYRKP